jgi:hypothetical protein
MARNRLGSDRYIKLQDHTTAGTAAVNSDIVDVAGYQGVVFFTSVGTANATNSLKVQGNTANQTTGMTDLLGTSLASGTDLNDVIIEVHKPQYRYLRVVATRGASTTLESVWAHLYGGRGNSAKNNVAATQTSELHVSPAAGTA